jgi:hypothetical protein
MLYTDYININYVSLIHVVIGVKMLSDVIRNTWIGKILFQCL